MNEMSVAGLFHKDAKSNNLQMITPKTKWNRSQIIEKLKASFIKDPDYKHANLT